MSKKTQKQAITIGSIVTIPAGKRVNRAGTFTIRKAESQVTVRAIEKARDGKLRVYWKSHGVLANALI